MQYASLISIGLFKPIEIAKFIRIRREQLHKIKLNQT
jgi:hypothetical protein